MLQLNKRGLYILSVSLHTAFIYNYHEHLKEYWVMSLSIL